MGKKILLIAAIAVAAFLVFRELGYSNLALYESQSKSSSRLEYVGITAPKVLTGEEEKNKAGWLSHEISDLRPYRVYYIEKCTGPWSRWIPLVKIGNTKIVREFFVTSGEGKVMWGKSNTDFELSAYGYLSARQYAELAEVGDRKAFLKSVEAKIGETLGKH